MLPARWRQWMILVAVAILAQLKRELAAVLGVQQILAELADVAVRGLVHSNQHHLPRDQLATGLDVHNRRHMHGGCHTEQVIPGDFADFLLVPIWPCEAVQAVGFEHNVRENPLQPHMHLMGESGHDAVHNDERADAEGDADNGGKGDVSRPEITPREQEFVHR